MEKSRISRIELWSLIAILIFALFLRVYNLGNASFWIDESISSMVSKNILEKGVPLLDSGWFYGGAYVFHYFQAFFLFLFMSEFGARIFSALIGVLTVLLAYFIGREYSKSGGIISALFMSVFFLEVFFSRQARYYQLFQLMFFLSLYLLYKSKENPKFLYLAILSFFITLDTKIAGIILAPFFILHILFYNRKQWFLSLIPVFFLVKDFIPASTLSSVSVSSSSSSPVGLTEESSNLISNLANRYFGYTANMLYLLILFVSGVLWAFFKKKRLTLLIVLPSLIMLTGIFSLELFALRYAYFFAFPLILYSSLLISFLYEKFGKIILIAVVALLIFPSNIFFPYTYVNVLIPIDYNYNDPSAPWTDYKSIPDSLKLELISNTTLISLFPADVEWYLRKPDYVIPFSMDGRGEDQISFTNLTGDRVGRYSGAKIINYSDMPERPYYVTADYFSFSKLKPSQRENFDKLTGDCEVSYESRSLRIFYCPSNKVSRVIDGDTFELEGGEKVRLICIDTPETGENGYEEAKNFLIGLIENKTIILEKDVSDKDAYGRLLRYVYLNESGEGLFVNKEIVRAGFGEVWAYGNDTAKCGEIGR
jgi:endonuclease YncB( thermonuclease family)